MPPFTLIFIGPLPPGCNSFPAPLPPGYQLYMQFIAFDTSTWFAEDYTEGPAITIGEG